MPEINFLFWNAAYYFYQQPGWMCKHNKTKTDDSKTDFFLNGGNEIVQKEDD